MNSVPALDWLRLAIFLGGILSLIAGTEWLIRRSTWTAPAGRKVLHLLVGLLVLPTPYLFQSPIPLMGIAALFAIVNSVALSGTRLPSLAAGRRDSLGTVFFPIAYALLLWAFWQRKPVIVVAMAALAIGDVLAATVGQRIPRPHRIRISPDPKSLEGSLVMFVSTAFLTALGFSFLPDAPPLSPGMLLWAAVVIGLCATAAEIISYRGSDNLTVPIVTAVVASFFLHDAAASVGSLSFGLGMALVLALLSVRGRLLDPGGAVALFLMGTLIFATGGWAFALPIVAFFVSSSLLSRAGGRLKAPLRRLFQKTGRRDLGQVVANGLLPTGLSLIWYLHPAPVWYLLYLASLAAVTADTWATEIGVLSPGSPRSIVNGKRVPRGTSGGVSLLGLTGALAGSAFIPATAYLAPASPDLPLRVALWVSVSGFSAHLVDSWLGATLQAQYRCQQCGQLTERRQHCSSGETRLFRGLPWLDNDLVNAACAVSGAGLLLIIRSVMQFQGAGAST